MLFDLISPVRIRGEAALPGDSGLTLTALMLGSLAGDKVTVRNLSPSPETALLIECLRGWGVEITESDGAATVCGTVFEREVFIPVICPDGAMAAAAAAGVFSGRSVRVENRGPGFEEAMEDILSLLRGLGYKGDVEEDGSGIVFDGSASPPAGSCSAETSGEAEAAAAAALVTGTPVEIVSLGSTASRAFRILSRFGDVADQRKGAGEGGEELARRRARAAGAKMPDSRWFAPSKGEREIVIPGDTLIGAAVAASAAALPGSDVRIRAVSWEPERRGFFDALRRMKAGIEWTPIHGYSLDAADVWIHGTAREGVHLTPRQAETIGPELLLLGPVAAAVPGETLLRGSHAFPRFGALKTVYATGLELLGADTGEFMDGIVVKGGVELRGNLVDSDEDPAVAIAFAVAGFIASGTTSVFGFDPNAFPVGDFFRIIGGLSPERMFLLPLAGE